jgi:acetyltransferase
MTIRNFDALFAPRAIALIGASNQPGSVGSVVARNLMAGGFAGPIMMVNPHASEIAGTLAFPDVASLPQTPDLAVIATPVRTVPSLVKELGEHGCRAAVVISAGFGTDDLRQQLLDASLPTLTRIVGPNCLGFLSPVNGINASFAQLKPARGSIALLSQSGAILTAMIDWAAASDIGFSHVVSLGDMSDVDFGDLLDYLALDSATSAVLLYVETVTHARKFMSAARIAARTKPVIVVKAGRSAAGALAAATHTGALAGADLVYDAAFRRAGMLRVDDLRDLFDAAATLASGIRVSGDQLMILTNGGGAGVLATDTLESRGGRLAPLSDAARSALDKTMPANWSRANPIDIIGDANADRYARALAILQSNNEQDAILVLNCPTGVADSMVTAEAIIAAARSARSPLLTCWLGEATARAPRLALAAHKIPTYETPDDAIRAFMQLVDYRHNQETLVQTPAAGADVSADSRATARSIISVALADGRAMLSEPEAKAVLAAYNIPAVETHVAATPEAAEHLASKLAGPFAVKILSHDISHKSDIGGVALNLATSEAVGRAAATMLGVIAAKAPNARIDGFTVQPMIKRPKAIELIAGLSVDPTFGPVILFGQGGIAVEVVADRAMALPPLNSVLADDLISRTRVAKLLAGYRNVPPANMGAIRGALIGLSDLAADIPEIVGIDINPLLADSEGVIALDARIEVRSASAASDQRFAIRPYPSTLRQDVQTEDGARFILRPIRPMDEPALVELCARGAPQDLRLRFFGSTQELSHTLAARLTQIDYDREMAFVAEGASSEGMLGVSRLIIEPNFKQAEFAVLVRSDLKGYGLGYQLMHAILSYARSRGVECVVGDVLNENAAMRQMTKALGGSLRPRQDCPNISEATFSLI